MDPEKLKEWQLIAQNAIVCLLGAFILAFEVIARDTPDPTAVGAGLTLLLAPPVRAYFAGQKRNGAKHDEDRE